jgi:uncharacterized protein YeaO (DUF488 family)
MTSGKRQFRIKRVYDLAADEDGFRMPVDRLWPRGMSSIDLRMKAVAPSDALRRQFLAAYADELQSEPARSAAAELQERLRTSCNAKDGFEWRAGRLAR